MLTILVGTGPLVAWFNAADRQHRPCSAFLEEFEGSLLTTWLVLVEVCFLLPNHLVASFLDWVADGGLSVVDLPGTAAPEIAAMMHKYGDRPMDLADASLLWVSSRLGVEDVLTIDHADFAAYRNVSGRPLNDLLATR